MAVQPVFDLEETIRGSALEKGNRGAYNYKKACP